MLDFIYDSLDTVKKLKFPTWKQIGNLSLAILILVIITGLYFVLTDSIFSNLYSSFAASML